MRRFKAVVLGILTAGTLVGCDSRAETGETEQASKAPAVRAGRYTVETALRDLPPVQRGEGKPVFISMGDLVSAAALGDLPKPDNALSSQKWVGALTKGPLYVVGPGTLRQFKPGAVRPVLGFDARDIQAFAGASTQTQDLLVVDLVKGARLKANVSATGAAKPGEIDPAPSDQAAFPNVHGVAQRGERVALSQYPDTLAAWSERGESSMADDDALLEVAKALDAQGVYSAALTNGPEQDRGMTQETYDALQSTPMPSFNAAGVGQKVVEGKELELVAYQFDDAASARASVQKVWSDGISANNGAPLDQDLEVGKVSVDGNVVVLHITPRPGKPGAASGLLGANDTPFMVLP